MHTSQVVSASSLERPGRADGSSRFAWPYRVYFDELDAMGMLHNARYALVLERCSSAFFESRGWQWDTDPTRTPDAHHVVVEQSIRYMVPVRGTADVVVYMWVEELGRTSATYGFEVCSTDAAVVHARARRVTVKLDPGTFRPVAWTARLRNCLVELLAEA